MLTLLHTPFDHNSSYLRGAALAPDRIEEALFRAGMNLCSEDGTDLAEVLESVRVESFSEIEKRTADLLARNKRLLALGGDHSVSRPLIRAHADKYPGLVVVQFDAHPDLYPQYEGNPDSHASPFARLLEEGTISRLIQIGIRAQNAVQESVARRHNVMQIPMAQLPETLSLEIEGPLYISLDIDVLDPAFAPGVSHREPGGMSTRDLLTMLGKLPPAVGADLVEYNPTVDPCGVTAAVAAKLVKELAAGMLSRTN